MDWLIARVKAILVTPQTEWLRIAREPGSPVALLTGYVAILAAIPALARFIGSSLIGAYTPVVFGFGGAIVSWLLTFGVVYAVAIIIQVLAPRFGGRLAFKTALKLSVYSFTPFWLSGIVLLIPGLSFLIVLGFYGVYIFWIGASLLMPRDKTLGLVAIVTFCATILVLVVGAIRAVVFS